MWGLWRGRVSQLSDAGGAVHQGGADGEVRQLVVDRRVSRVPMRKRHSRLGFGLASINMCRVVLRVLKLPHRTRTMGPFVEQLLGRMTLLEKIGQMTQADIKSLRDGSIRDLGLGSVLSGAGVNPTPNNPQTWSEMVRRVQAEALESRLGVPLLYGVDAVHGHNNVRGATVFPQNIGLGATQDAELVERIGDVTPLELLAPNVPWTISPALSVPQDIRWGRTYEGFSQDPALVASLGAAFIRGLSGTGV